MTTLPISASSFSPSPPSSERCAALKQIVETIVQIAIQVLFVGIFVWISHSFFPIVVTPVVGIGSALLASSFFSKTMQPPPPVDPLPLIRPIKAPRIAEDVFSPERPRGIANAACNCSFNSAIHLIETEPGISRWLRDPVADFEEMLRGYHTPERIIEAFRQYTVNALPLPAPFEQFIDHYQPEIEDYAGFRKIQETYRKMVILKASFNRFFEGYDRADLEADSQQLRIAVSELNVSISADGREQEDASEVLQTILEVVPDAEKIQIQETIYYDTDALPSIAGALDGVCPSPPELHGLLTLEFTQGKRGERLEDMLNTYLDHEMDSGGVNKMGVDGVVRRYRPTRRTVAFLREPPVLRLMLKRFSAEREQNFWGWFRRGETRVTKNSSPVEVPEELTIALANGERARYRLMGFINQHGSTIKSGHYTAARVMNGEKWLISDRSVTLADQAAWESRSRQAYLLWYLPVPPPQD